jgi:transposase
MECIRLADQGWPVPQIAAHLNLHQATIWRTIHRLEHGGLDGLADRPRCGCPPRLTRDDLDALDELLTQAAARDEIWTLAQLAGWLAQTRHRTISPQWLDVLLRRRGCHWTAAIRSPECQHGSCGAPG